MDARDMHFVVASGNSMSSLKPMFAETFDRLHFVAENGGQVVSYDKLLCQEFMGSNDVENLLRYFNYDLLAKATIFNGAQGYYMLKGSRVNFEMITEEEQKALEAAIQRLNGLKKLIVFQRLLIVISMVILSMFQAVLVPLISFKKEFTLKIGFV